MVRWARYAIALYDDCASRHDGLIDGLTPARADPAQLR